MNNFEKGALIILLAVIVLVIIVLLIVLLLMRKNEEESKVPGANAVKQTPLGMSYDDIKNFLPFDDIKDNMIVQEKGEKYTMLVGCRGINYYLMSEAEKISVEEGFIQFLNSIRFPIQIYVQSRTINLDDSIRTYYERLEKIQIEFSRLLDKFQLLSKKGASTDELLELGYQLEKKEKVLNYTKDLIENIAYMTQNSNVLQKKYYIAVSYHVAEAGIVNSMSSEDLYRVAYTELTNRAESICGGLISSGVEAEILDTYELTEVMYIAVNRDDADIFNIKKIIDSQISSISITAKSPEEKRRELLKAEQRAREIQEEQERAMLAEAQRQEYLANYGTSASSSRNSGGIDASTML